MGALDRSWAHRMVAMKRISVSSAISVGTAWVNLPVVPIMFAPIALFIFFGGDALNRKPSGADFLMLLGLFILGFGLSWTWWSVMVPRWRLWAWARVEDGEELRRRAVRSGLIWPAGHFLERTEIRTGAVSRRLQELESRRRSG